MNLSAFFGTKIWLCVNFMGQSWHKANILREVQISHYANSQSRAFNLCRYAFALLCISAFCACGYLPTSKVASNVFGEKIYISPVISQQDSRNSIYIVDTIRELVINKLGKSPSLKEEADDILYVAMESLNFIPIIYDENGYVIAYKARIVLVFDASFKDGRKEKLKTSGDYDFAISPNTVISDTARFEAIRVASSEAFDEFVSAMAIKGHLNGTH